MANQNAAQSSEGKKQKARWNTLVACCAKGVDKALCLSYATSKPEKRIAAADKVNNKAQVKPHTSAEGLSARVTQILLSQPLTTLKTFSLRVGSVPKIDLTNDEPYIPYVSPVCGD